MEFRDVMEFERGLSIGDKVEVRWTAGSFGHYRSPATILRLNAASIRVTLDAPVDTGEWGIYPAGREIVVPRAWSLTGSSTRWAWHNGVFPLEPEAVPFPRSHGFETTAGHAEGPCPTCDERDQT